LPSVLPYYFTILNNKYERTVLLLIFFFVTAQDSDFVQRCDPRKNLSFEKFQRSATSR
jgi:hypothetical protein